MAQLGVERYFGWWDCSGRLYDPEEFTSEEVAEIAPQLERVDDSAEGDQLKKVTCRGRDLLVCVCQNVVRLSSGEEVRASESRLVVC